jgi:hypothetical protein
MANRQPLRPDDVEELMEAHDPCLAQAMAHANEVFGRLAGVVETAATHAPSEPIDLLAVCRTVGFELDEALLKRLEIPFHIYPLTALPWYQWWPYQPLWAWWWQQNHPRYRCGPYLLIRRNLWTTEGGRPTRDGGTPAEACCGSGSQER